MPIKSDLNMIVAVTDLSEFSRFSLVTSPVPMSPEAPARQRREERPSLLPLKTALIFPSVISSIPFGNPILFAESSLFPLRNRRST